MIWISQKIRKSKIAPFFVLVLVLLLNFCGIQSLAFSLECDHHNESAEESHSRPQVDNHSKVDDRSHDENHPKSHANSHDDEEDPFCCSTIKSVSITSEQNLTFDFLKDFSSFLDSSNFSVAAEISQLSEFWRSFHYLGPPGADRFKIIFLTTSPTHAPPVPYTI